jgi:dTDP-4-dehydrorhamnose 3,5-epimerase
MVFTETKLKGAFIIDPEKQEDDRGFFARTYCQSEFARYGLTPHFVQCNISFTAKRGTLRGMHYQIAPYEEAKLVRCTRGAIYDVLLDLRPDSPTFKEWISIELTAENHRLVYIPEGLAHGFQSFTDGTEVFYQMSQCYHPQSARGIRWDDPAFGIGWPVREVILSNRDTSFAFFRG